MAKSAQQNTGREKRSSSRALSLGQSKASVTSKKTASKSRKDAQHVIGHDGGWVVKSSRSGRFVTTVYPNKSDAIDAGRKIARTSGGELLVHGRSGQIFQHTSVPSTLREDVVRKLIRTANKKTIATTKSKKSVSVNSKKTASKKK